ncbi:MAG: hypothetical protein PHO04_01195 [Candidatus Pacebacteria bacterium]|jgi:hypothetical protein|nr:hypothetical protein [Candidatus Paceibacterota bacterium]MDD3918658.1 hypothetical protein [Candidatus Paceibacterota bacterium]MDD4664617.1 hypothetical protein [Candidatus Paceibacterota bacterium]
MKQVIRISLLIIVLILGIICFLKITNKEEVAEYREEPLIKEREIETVLYDIFNTSGTILNTNPLIIRGTGNNFQDQSPRDLTIFIDENTKVNGLKTFKLKIGDNISIEAPYSIYEKQEFLAQFITINKR